MASRGGGRRTYVRDANGRFASTPGGGGGSKRPKARMAQRGPNRLTRDNAGKITSQGGNGATVRGGRLRTAGGNLRATQLASMKAAGFRGSTIAKGGRGIRGSVARSLAAVRKERMAGAKAMVAAAPTKSKAKGSPRPGQVDRAYRRAQDAMRRRSTLQRGTQEDYPLNAKGQRKRRQTSSTSAKAASLLRSGITRKPLPHRRGEGPLLRASRPAGTVAKPKGLKPGALAERRGRKVAAVKPADAKRPPGKQRSTYGAMQRARQNLSRAESAHLIGSRTAIEGKTKEQKAKGAAMAIRARKAANRAIAAINIYNGLSTPRAQGRMITRILGDIKKGGTVAARFYQSYGGKSGRSGYFW